ncbi:MAG TPA: BamA/TamA family outer membrane protein [Gemmatimonadaceae bacterium]|nr:BamA/TamA family outer membrane protein [Gemmatimonadaceae bacterium]
MRHSIYRWLATYAAGAALVAPQLLGAQNTRDQQREAPEVRKLTFSGVKSVDQNDLQKSIATQATKCRSMLLMPFCWISHSPTIEDKHYLDQAEFERDVLRVRLYYWKHGYRDATVDTTVARSGAHQVHIAFNVHENQPTVVRKIAIKYDSSLISDKVRNRLTVLRAAKPLDLVLLDSMRLMFQNELWDLGYGDAVIDATVNVDSVARVGDVAMTLTPNRRTTIGTITIAGNQRVNIATIRNSLTFQKGDLYRQKDILESQRNLYESNLFRLAAIDVPPQYDSVKNVIVDVTEAPMHEARVGPGISSVDFLQFQAHYTAYNMLGGARRLDVDATAGNLFASALQGRGFFRDVSSEVGEQNVSPYLEPTYNASIDFKQPAFLQRPKDQAAVGVFTHRNINPGVFIDRGYGGQTTLTHQFLPRFPVSINYRYELNRVDASEVYFCVNFGVCDTRTIVTLRSHHSLSPLTLTGFIDHSDSPFSPTKGYLARVDLEHASQFTASDYQYNRAFFDGSLYAHRSGTLQVLATHLRVGWVRPIVAGLDSGVLHPRKRFYAGGANSVRGYAESQLGPRVLTIDATSLGPKDSFNGGVCEPTLGSLRFCDPNSRNLGNGDFVSQPLGGTSLVEGSVEYRMPLPLGPNLRHFVGAVFVDAGIVGSASVRGLETISNFVKGTWAVTPGFGIRYQSPVGPIRVDLGINPGKVDQLAVVTALQDSTGRSIIVPLLGTRGFSSGKTFLNRLVLHFSIGEAY